MVALIVTVVAMVQFPSYSGGSIVTMVAMVQFNGGNGSVTWVHKSVLSSYGVAMVNNDRLKLLSGLSLSSQWQ
jgi:hypothetical protein